jgi:tetratricopeptide (TPR) repeat protein
MDPSSPSAGSATAAEDSAALFSIRRHEERLAKDPASLAFAPLADAYRKAGRTREAVRLCREGLERFPEYPTARLILAKALRDDGDAESALAEVRRILERNPADAQAHRLAGDLERRAGRLPEAVVHLRQATTLDPSDRESRTLLDMLEGHGKAAGVGLARLLADDTFATMSFGAVCLEQGLAEEAAQIFVRILRRDPDHAAARRQLDEAVRMKMQRRKGS